MQGRVSFIMDILIAAGKAKPMRMVDATYRTIADREHRALAGLSIEPEENAPRGSRL